MVKIAWINTKPMLKHKKGAITMDMMNYYKTSYEELKRKADRQEKLIEKINKDYIELNIKYNDLSKKYQDMKRLKPIQPQQHNQ